MNKNMTLWKYLQLWFSDIEHRNSLVGRGQRARHSLNGSRGDGIILLWTQLCKIYSRQTDSFPSNLFLPPPLVHGQPARDYISVSHAPKLWPCNEVLTNGIEVEWCAPYGHHLIQSRLLAWTNFILTPF